jgi:hypothetical protein
MLRLEIDGHWEPEDFIEVLKGIESLYYKAALRRRFLYEPPFYWFERSPFAFSFEEHLDSSNDWLLARAAIIYLTQTMRLPILSPGG